MCGWTNRQWIFSIATCKLNSKLAGVPKIRCKSIVNCGWPGGRVEHSRYIFSTCKLTCWHVGLVLEALVAGASRVAVWSSSDIWNRTTYILTCRRKKYRRITVIDIYTVFSVINWGPTSILWIILYPFSILDIFSISTCKVNSKLAGVPKIRCKSLLTVDDSVVVWNVCD